MTINQVIETYEPVLLGFVQKRIQDQEIAKDLHQEILIKIFTHYASLKNEDQLKSWVYRIAHNTIIDYYRQQDFTFSTLSEQAVAVEEENPFAAEETLLICLEPFLQQLKPHHQQALALVDLGNYSQKALAQKMNMSYSGAKSTVQRARQQLRKVFDQCCKIEADRYGNILSITPHTSKKCS
ncbi:MAG: sigma-70 family RNA polymerase sigma factor [Thermonemataceae bacterium]